MTFDEWFDKQEWNGTKLARSIAARAWQAALESRVLAERKEPDCTCASNPHAETCPVTAHVRSLFKASGETAYATHPTPDDAARYPHAAIGAALIASGLYDRMRDITGGDREARKLIEELIATVDPVLDRWHSAAIDQARQSGEEGND